MLTSIVTKNTKLGFFTNDMSNASGNQTIINVADPVNAQDAVTKNYLTTNYSKTTDVSSAISTALVPYSTTSQVSTMITNQISGITSGETSA